MSGHVPEDSNVVQLASELASNAVKHSGTEFTVCIGMRADQFRVEVADRASTVRIIAANARDPEPGRGLHLVQALSTVWGVGERLCGKSVFFEVPDRHFAATG